MKDTTTKCLVCGESLDGGLPVWCADCSTPHHRDCFAYAGRCAIFGCSGRRFTDSRVGPGVSTLEIQAPDGTASPRNVIVDFTSHREQALNLAVMAAFGLIALAGFDIDGPALGLSRIELAGAGVLCLVASLVARFGVSDYRVVAGKDRTVWLHRSFFGHTSLTREATFTECRNVVLSFVTTPQGQRSWSLWLDLVDDSAIQMLDAISEPVGPHSAPKPPAAVHDAANAIANVIGLSRTIRGGWTPARARVR